MSLYPNTCEVQKVTIARTTSGTANPTYATRIASLTCSIQNRNLRTVNEFGKETLTNVYKLYTPYDSTSTTMKESDRVIWDGRTFEITGIGDGAGRRHHLEIDMLEVD